MIPQSSSQSAPLLSAHNDSGQVHQQQQQQTMVVLRLSSLRWVTLISVALNSALVSLGSVLLGLLFGRCGPREKVAATAAAALAAVKVWTIVGGGIAQGATAAAIAGSGDDEDDDSRRVRKVICPSVVCLNEFCLLFCIRGAPAVRNPAVDLRTLHFYPSQIDNCNDYSLA